MIDTQSDFRTEAATIRFGGRELPRGVRIKNGRGRSTALAAGSHTRDIAVDDRQREFEEKLLQTIRRESGVDVFRRTDISDRDDLVIAYCDTLTALKRLSADWNEFVRKLVRIDLRSEESLSKNLDEAFREESEKVREEVLADAALRPFYFSSVLTGALISQDLAVAFADLVADVEKKAEELHAAILDQLIRLIELEVCGLLVRYPNQVYAYHYFFRELRAKKDREYIKQDTEFTLNRPDINQPFFLTTRVEEGSATLTLCRRVHHIINGIEVAPDRPSVPTPRFYQELLKTIPLWLRPMTILVEGTLVGEAGIDQDISECTKVVEEELLLVRYYYDPALVLGQIVLTGWGPRELAAEDEEGKRLEATNAGTIGSRLSASWKTLSLLPAKAIAAAVSLSDQNHKREL